MIPALGYAFVATTYSLRDRNLFDVCKITSHLNFDCIMISLLLKARAGNSLQLIISLTN